MPNSASVTIPDMFAVDVRYCDVSFVSAVVVAVDEDTGNKSQS